MSIKDKIALIVNEALTSGFCGPAPSPAIIARISREARDDAEILGNWSLGKNQAVEALQRFLKQRLYA